MAKPYSNVALVNLINQLAKEQGWSFGALVGLDKGGETIVVTNLSEMDVHEPSMAAALRIIAGLVTVRSWASPFMQEAAPSGAVRPQPFSRTAADGPPPEDDDVEERRPSTDRRGRIPSVDRLSDFTLVELKDIWVRLLSLIKQRCKMEPTKTVCPISRNYENASRYLPQCSKAACEPRGSDCVHLRKLLAENKSPWPEDLPLLENYKNIQSCLLAVRQALGFLNLTEDEIAKFIPPLESSAGRAQSEFAAQRFYSPALFIMKMALSVYYVVQLFILHSYRAGYGGCASPPFRAGRTGRGASQPTEAAAQRGG